jgi:hypothetical protein
MIYLGIGIIDAIHYSWFTQKNNESSWRSKKRADDRATAMVIVFSIACALFYVLNHTPPS